MSQKPQELLRRHFSEISLLSSTQAALEWDERTGLPRAAASFRADQITYLSGLVHAKRTAACVGEWLDELADEVQNEKGEGISPLAAAYRCWRKDYDRDTKLPQKLVEALAKATTLGQSAWSEARPKNDFASFFPHLNEIIRLRKEEASLLRRDDQSLYDVMLDQYEEDARATSIASTFEELKGPLVALVQQLDASKSPPTGSLLQQEYNVDEQRKLSHWIAEKIGFDFERGRLDTTDHPFCTTLGPNDHRILTRYIDDHFSSGFFGTLHEAGHGLYEQGLPTDWFGAPPGQYASLGVHESQSRLWENMVGRSRSFWRWAYPFVQKSFPKQLKIEAEEEFYRDLNRVSKSLIRVDADEATYNLHVMIRFELEQGIFDDSIRAQDLPTAWNERYHDYLGIVPPNDADGVLQDVHWSAGLFGYFPTYTLGNIYAAQLFATADKELGGLEGQFACGEFSPLLKWLRERVHSHGRQWKPRDLITMATGVPISSRPLIEYLTSKLVEVYRL